jgi:hypothetical protein
MSLEQVTSVQRAAGEAQSSLDQKDDVLKVQGFSRDSLDSSFTGRAFL